MAHQKPSPIQGSGKVITAFMPFSSKKKRHHPVGVTPQLSLKTNKSRQRKVSRGKLHAAGNLSSLPIYIQSPSGNQFQKTDPQEATLADLEVGKTEKQNRSWQNNG
jgi:hypothetical protein